jgi:transcriptional regulator with XRE-family HTH domain
MQQRIAPAPALRDAGLVHGKVGPVKPGSASPRACLDCGTALRRTNAENRCAACIARVRSEHPIPASFWYADDVAAALAQWDLRTVVRLVHSKLGLTQLTIANLAGYSQASISRWLHHDGSPEGVTAQRLRQFVEGLAIPWELLGLLDPAMRESSDGQVSGRFGSNGAAEEDHQAMKRRAFVVSSSLAVGITALGTASADIWNGTLGSAHARYLQQASRQLIEQNFRLSGDMLFGQAAAQFELVYSKIRSGDHAATAEPALFAAAGELARCAGWIAHDAGREHDARYYFNEALLAARLSDNRQLAFKTYYSMSVQADEQGHASEALHLVRAAKRAAKGWAPGRLMSLLACAEARAMAGMRQPAQVEALLGQARNLYHAGNRGLTEEAHAALLWDIYFFYDEAEILGFEGICDLKLEAYSAAEALLQQEIEQHAVERGADYQRNTTLEFGRLALAQLGQANITGAATTGQTVLATLRDGVLSSRTLKVVSTVAEGMSTYRTVPAADAFLKDFRASANGMAGWQT